MFRLINLKVTDVLEAALFMNSSVLHVNVSTLICSIGAKENDSRQSHLILKLPTPVARQLHASRTLSLCCSQPSEVV